MKQHPTKGVHILAAVPLLKEKAGDGLMHHENVDGSGYPDGLKGEAIPLGARIVRLVDTTAAVLQDRPARETMRLEEAMQLLHNGLGREFCPRITPVFLECLSERANAIDQILAPEEPIEKISERSIDVTVRSVIPQ